MDDTQKSDGDKDAADGKTRRIEASWRRWNSSGETDLKPLEWILKEDEGDVTANYLMGRQYWDQMCTHLEAAKAAKSIEDVLTEKIETNKAKEEAKKSVEYLTMIHQIVTTVELSAMQNGENLQKVHEFNEHLIDNLTYLFTFLEDYHGLFTELDLHYLFAETSKRRAELKPRLVAAMMKSNTLPADEGQTKTPTTSMSPDINEACGFYAAKKADKEVACLYFEEAIKGYTKKIEDGKKYPYSLGKEVAGSAEAISRCTEVHKTLTLEVIDESLAAHKSKASSIGKLEACIYLEKAIEDYTKDISVKTSSGTQPEIIQKTVQAFADCIKMHRLLAFEVVDTALEQHYQLDEPEKHKISDDAVQRLMTAKTYMNTIKKINKMFEKKTGSDFEDDNVLIREAKLEHAAGNYKEAADKFKSIYDRWTAVKKEILTEALFCGLVSSFAARDSKEVYDILNIFKEKRESYFALLSRYQKRFVVGLEAARLDTEGHKMAARYKLLWEGVVKDYSLDPEFNQCSFRREYLELGKMLIKRGYS